MNESTFLRHGDYGVMLRSQILRLLVVALAFLGSILSAHAQSPQPAIVSVAYANKTYAFSSQTTAGSGIAVLHYIASDAGTADLTWNTTTSAFVSLALSPHTGASVTYTNAGIVDQPATLVVSSGGTNALSSIGRTHYSASSTWAQPSPAIAPMFHTFVYAAETYTRTQSWTDMLGIDQHVYHGILGGSAKVSGSSDYSSYFAFSPGVASITISTASSLTAKYAPVPGGLGYVLSADSTGPNTLSSIDGVPLKDAGRVATVSAPFQAFAYNGEIFILDTFEWEPMHAPAGSSIAYRYAPTAGTSTMRAFCVLSQNMPFGARFSSLKIFLDDYDANGDLSDSVPATLAASYEDGTAHGSQAGTLYYTGGTTGNILTGVGTTSYTASGNFLTPATVQLPVSPIKTFEYGGEYFTINKANTTWNNGNAVYQFRSADGGTASVNVDPTSKSVTAWTINSATLGLTANYAASTDSAHPGAYVSQGGGSTPNVLTWVNNVAYNVDGDIAAPPDTTSDQGDLNIQGNQFKLGVWTGSPSQTGMTMTYYDGGNDFETVISLASSRPYTDWSWEHPASDSSNPVLAMELGTTHILQLYPAQQTVGPSGLVPSVVLDPNPGGISRFDGPVRIAPQGDLLMGEFTNEPAQ